MKKDRSKKSQKQKLRILLYVLIIINFILIGFLFARPTGKAVYTMVKTNVTRVIDGDTIITELGKVRLLGVNTPEKRRYYYVESTEFLLDLEGKEIELEIKEVDMFNRILGYVFYNNRFINKEILENGYGHYFAYADDHYTKELKKAEKRAREKEIGIWERSHDECSRCIELIEFNNIDPGEYIILKNTCNFNCELYGWTIKDETSAHIEKLAFSINAGNIKTIRFHGRVWNDDHDTLYLRDDSGLLVLWYRY
jgi:endonuclease YncB( thermonuclease family)